MNEEPTVYNFRGSRQMAATTTSNCSKDPQPGALTVFFNHDSRIIFNPLQLERSLLLILLPLFAAACFVVATAELLMGAATWFELYQLPPIGLAFIGLYLWAFRSRPESIHRVRWATLALATGIVMERLILGLWWTYQAGGHEGLWITGGGVWLILAACLLVYLVPGRRSLVLGFGYYALTALAIGVFSVGFGGELPDHVAHELYVTILAAMPVFLALTAAMVQLRRAYGSALSRASEFEAQAMQDGLTGLFNRRALVHSLDRARSRQKRRGTPVSLILCDIDHFKWINDLYGHVKGDEALVRFARVLTSTMRRTDDVIRWGGEEFLIVLEETDEKGAAEVAERLRELVENADLIKGRKITASFGVTGLHLRESDIEAFTRLDEALFQAKDAGRNRVVTQPMPDRPAGGAGGSPTAIAVAELVDDTSWALS